MKFCPECGQKLPTALRGRICGKCGRHIRQGEHWHMENSMIVHNNCDDPKDKARAQQPMLIGK